MTLEVHRFGETTVYVLKPEENNRKKFSRTVFYLSVGTSLSITSLSYLKNHIPCKGNAIFILTGETSCKMNLIQQKLLYSHIHIVQAIPLFFATIIWGKRMPVQQTHSYITRQIAKENGDTLTTRVIGSCLEPLINKGDDVFVHLGQKPLQGEIGLIQGSPPIAHIIRARFSLFGWTIVLHSGEKSRVAPILETEVLGRVEKNSKES